MRLIMIRHGRTASNVDGLLDTAPPGAELDEAGLEQARVLADRLAAESLDAVYASDLVRTRQTAQPLAERHGVEVAILEGLREIQAGDQELSDVWDDYIAVLRGWAMGDTDARRPGGDTFHEFFERFDAAVHHIATAGHEVAALVSHGAALRTWTGQRVNGMTPRDAATRALGNTAVVVLEGSPADGWTLVEWDDGVPAHQQAEAQLDPA